mmetsp:Transcript_70939/g.219015  ORF Transcript_70939/g.219015 Transcript_70939/m.219015 type:complete len:344 (-) Transcript_70939:975-2006(-)
MAGLAAPAPHAAGAATAPAIRAAAAAAAAACFSDAIPGHCAASRKRVGDSAGRRAPGGAAAGREHGPARDRGHSRLAGPAVEPQFATRPGRCSVRRQGVPSERRCTRHSAPAGRVHARPALRGPARCAAEACLVGAGPRRGLLPGPRCVGARPRPLRRLPRRTHHCAGLPQHGAGPGVEVPAAAPRDVLPLLHPGACIADGRWQVADVGSVDPHHVPQLRGPGARGSAARRRRRAAAGRGPGLAGGGPGRRRGREPGAAAPGLRDGALLKRALLPLLPRGAFAMCLPHAVLVPAALAALRHQPHRGHLARGPRRAQDALPHGQERLSEEPGPRTRDAPFRRHL